MKSEIYIRQMNKEDLTNVKSIIEENHMFPSEYLDDMVVDYFSHESEDMWFIAENHTKDVIAVAYVSPERMTEGTWNLLLIAVSTQFQGFGVGSLVIQHTEEWLQEKNARVLLVETSGLPEYQLTRQFYPKCGYVHVATIPEYYAENDDKVVFYKKLM